MPRVATLLFDVSTSDSNGTTYDATVAGLGDVTGFFYNFAAVDLDGTPDGNRYEYEGCGGIDSGGSFDCYSISNYDRHNLGTADCYRTQTYNGNANIFLLDSIEVSVSRITDGLRLTKVGGAGSKTRSTKIPIHVVTDCKVAIGTVTLNNPGGSISLTTNASDGSGNIDCNLVHFFGACNTLLNTQNIALLSSGWGQRISNTSFRQWSQNWHSRDGAATSDITSRLDTSAVMAQVAQGNLSYTCPITNWTANGSTSAITVRQSASTGDIFAYIAFEDTLKGYTDNGNFNAYTGQNYTLTGSSASGVSAKLVSMRGLSAYDDDVNDNTSTSSTCQYYWQSDQSSSATIKESNTYGYSQDNANTSVTGCVQSTGSGGASGSGFSIGSYSGFYNTRAAGPVSFNGQDVSVTTTTIDYSGQNIPYGYVVLSDDWLDGLLANLGTFTLTGNDATLSIVQKISTETGSFTLSGQQASLKITAAASTASFAVTGNAIGAVQKLGADAGTFSLTAPSITTETRLITAAGSFALTGVNAGLFVFSGVRAQVASFSLTGIDSTLRIKHLVDAGVFTLTGSPANLESGETLDALVGSFSLSGNDALFQVTFAASVGSLQLTGRPVGLIDTGNIIGTPYYYRFMMQDE
jgi:hypothetical protein